MLFSASLLVQSCTAEAVCSGEAEKADRIRDRIQNELPLRASDPVVEYVRDLGRRLAERAGIDGRARWRFQVVRDRSVNAFSIGDGRIYVTEGAILAASSEAELAGVIAHEMGHQLAGHFCPGSRAQSAWDDYSDGKEGRQRGKESTSPGVGSLRQGMDPAKEREADEYATRVLMDAGFDLSVRSDVMTRSRAEGPQARRYDTHQPPSYSSSGDQPRARPAPGGQSALERAKQVLRREL